MRNIDLFVSASVLGLALLAAPAFAQTSPDYNADAIRERLSGVTSPGTVEAPTPTPSTDPACATFDAQMNDPKCFAPAAGGQRQLFIYKGGAKPPSAAPPAMRRPTASIPAPVARPSVKQAANTPRAGQKRPARGSAAPAVAATAGAAVAGAGTSSNAAAASCVDQVADQAMGLNLCITFALASADLTPKAKANLDQFAAAIASGEFATLKFAIEGHADASGSDPKNKELSAQRAESVVNYMVSKGVARDRLTFAGFGSERPVTGQPKTAAVNRRVEARLIR